MREPCHFKVNQSENRIQEVGPIRRRTGYTQGGKMPNQSDKVPKEVGPIGKLVAYICTYRMVSPNYQKTVPKEVGPIGKRVAFTQDGEPIE